MSRDKELMTLRDSRIKARYRELYNKERMKSTDILKQLRAEFYLTERTIFDIVYGAAQSKRKRQKKKAG